MIEQERLMALVFLSLPLVLVTALMAHRTIVLIRERSYGAMMGELFIPMLLTLSFGVGGILLILAERPLRLDLSEGAEISDFHVVEAFQIILAVMAVYWFTFRLASARESACRSESAQPSRGSQDGVWIATLIFLAIDLAARAAKLQQGTYFVWLASDLKREADINNPLTLLQESVAPLLVVLLTWFAFDPRHKRVALPMLALLVVAGVLEGSRTTIFLFAISISIGWLQSVKARPIADLPFLKIGAIVLLSLFVAQVTQEVRAEFRLQRHILIENPSLLPEKLIFEFIPNALFGNDDELASRYVDDITEQQGLALRLAAWPAYLAAIRSRFDDGWQVGPPEHAIEALSMPIPAILYPGQKPAVSAGPQAFAHLQLGTTAHPSAKVDPATAVFTDAYLYYGIAGPLALSAMLGIFFGLTYRYLVNSHAALGALAFTGLTETMMIFGNSYASSFVRMRDTIIMILILHMGILIARSMAARAVAR